MKFLIPSLALGLCCWVGTAAGQERADETGAAMADAADRFLDSLTDAQRAEANFTFDSPERFNWHWIPRPRKGVPIKELSPEARALAFGLLNTGLSTKGMLKATTIMSLEEILRVAEHGTGPVRDPQLYYVSVFGTPSNEGEWGWRIEGHHLALNYTLKNGKVVSATPFMFGSNPAIVKSGPRQGLRNLEEIESPVNALLVSLNEEQRKAAIISTTDVPDVTSTPNSAQLEPSKPLGISSDALNSDQRALLIKFIKAYYLNFPDPIRDGFTQKLDSTNEVFHFAWYGPADPTQPHAFRVQGSSLLIDFNEKQDAANHIHTFYRSTVGDFGLPAAAAAAN